MAKDLLAVVTGGSFGIGGAISKRLAQENISVINFDLQEASDPDIRSCHKAFFEVDVRNKGVIDNAVKQVVETFGKIDILCNNAGVSTMSRVQDLTEEEWDFNFEINSKGVFLVSQSVLNQTMLQSQSGVIVNTASMAGLKGVPLLAHYAASKWAVIGFTKSLAVELAPIGIRVNAVCPGFVRTSMQERELKWEASLRNMTPEDVYKEYLALTPMGRIEEPTDVANAVWMLVSKDSSFITGEALAVTGGANL